MKTALRNNCLFNKPKKNCVIFILIIKIITFQRKHIKIKIFYT